MAECQIWVGSLMPRSWTEPDRILVKVARSIPPGRVLDVGCGGGHDSLWLAEQGWSVTAIDTSRHAVSKVRRLAKQAGLDLTASKADATALGTQAAYDLISICYMHLPAGDRSRMLSNAATALKPGATLLWRSFEASIEEAPFDRDLVPSREAVLEELGSGILVQRADVAKEFFPYMNKEMTLLTIVGVRTRRTGS